MKKLECIIPDFSDIIKVLDKKTQKHLLKFDWDWLKKLLKKWSLFYYDKYWQWQSKKEFLKSMYKDIIFYINYLSEQIKASDRKQRTEYFIKIELVLNKYYELIHDWDEVDTVELRKENISKRAWEIVELNLEK